MIAAVVFNERSIPTPLSSPVSTYVGRDHHYFKLL
jgi:hypothetical protein